jgi:nucleotide-binding universal stress UspA family protein
MYGNILLSTDGSDVATKGVKHGIALAKTLNAKVTVVTERKRCRSTMGADTPRDGFLRRKSLIVLTKPQRNLRAKCSMKLEF